MLIATTSLALNNIFVKILADGGIFHDIFGKKQLFGRRQMSADHRDGWFRKMHLVVYHVFLRRL